MYPAQEYQTTEEQWLEHPVHVHCSNVVTYMVVSMVISLVAICLSACSLFFPSVMPIGIYQQKFLLVGMIVFSLIFAYGLYKYLETRTFQTEYRNKPTKDYVLSGYWQSIAFMMTTLVLLMIYGLMYARL